MRQCLLGHSRLAQEHADVRLASVPAAREAELPSSLCLFSAAGSGCSASLLTYLPREVSQKGGVTEGGLLSAGGSTTERPPACPMSLQLQLCS